MSEISPSSSSSQNQGTRKRNLIIILSLIPLVAFFALLGWAVARSGGNPGGFGINSKFGEVAIDQRPAPGFTKIGLDGQEVSLSGVLGKVVMLDFWSSWCPPCRQEAPTLAEVYGEYRERGVEFVGVAIWDDSGNVARHIEEYNLTYPNILDDRGGIAIDYGVAGIPEKFFIDSQGMLVGKFVGPTDPEALRSALDGLLAP